MDARFRTSEYNRSVCGCKKVLQIPCKWTMLPVADSAEIQSLIEDGPDFAELEFWHNGKYYSISANASDYVPQGLVRLDGGEYYKSCTVTFAER